MPVKQCQSPFSRLIKIHKNQQDPLLRAVSLDEPRRLKLVFDSAVKTREASRVAATNGLERDVGELFVFC